MAMQPSGIQHQGTGKIIRTALEAMACGTPVAAFHIGGLPDIITHQENGWLAKPFDTDDLARGIDWMLSDETRCRHLSQQARQSVIDKYSPQKIASRYMEVYRNLLQQAK